jgi:hypothetical protein
MPILLTLVMAAEGAAGSVPLCRAAALPDDQDQVRLADLKKRARFSPARLEGAGIMSARFARRNRMSHDRPLHGNRCSCA